MQELGAINSKIVNLKLKTRNSQRGGGTQDSRERLPFKIGRKRWIGCRVANLKVFGFARNVDVFEAVLLRRGLQEEKWTQIEET